MFRKEEGMAYLGEMSHRLSGDIVKWGRSQWVRGLRRRSTAARLLQTWVQIPPGAWMVVCCVLSRRGFCGQLITRPRRALQIVARRCV
jgi:hypothetical protein